MSCLGIKYVRLPSASFFGMFGTYEVTEDWVMRDCGIYPPRIVVTQDYEDRVVTTHNPSGLLVIHRGFVCDGPSAFTIDRDENREAGFVHDANYRAFRTGEILDWEKARIVADDLYGQQCEESGMWPPWARANAWFVKKFGRSSAKPQVEEQLQVRE